MLPGTYQVIISMGPGLEQVNEIEVTQDETQNITVNTQLIIVSGVVKNAGTDEIVKSGQVNLYLEKIIWVVYGECDSETGVYQIAAPVGYQYYLNFGRVPNTSGTLVDIKEGTTEDIKQDLEMENLITVEGTVRDAEGKAVAETYIHMVNRIDNAFYSVLTDASGHYKIWLPAGKYTYVYNGLGYYEGDYSSKNVILMKDVEFAQSTKNLDVEMGLYKVQFDYQSNQELNTSMYFILKNKSTNSSFDIEPVNTASCYLAAGKYSLLWGESTLTEFEVTTKAQAVNITLDTCEVTLKMTNAGKATKLRGTLFAEGVNKSGEYDYGSIDNSEVTLMLPKGISFVASINDGIKKTFAIGTEDEQTINYKLGNLCEVTGTATNADGSAVGWLVFEKENIYIGVSCNKRGEYAAYLEPGTYSINGDKNNTIVIEEGMTSLERDIVLGSMGTLT